MVCQLACGQGLTSAKRARLTPGNVSILTVEGPTWRVRLLRPPLVPAKRLSPVDRCSISVDASRHEPTEPADSSADYTSDSGSKLPAAVDLCAWNPHNQEAATNVYIKLKFLRNSERFLGMYISREDATQIWYTLHDKHRVVGVSSVEYIDVHVPFCNQSHELVTDAIQEPRPRTGQLFVNMLKKLNAQVKSGCVTRIEGQTFIANLEIASKYSVAPLNIDCRPSDCINICMRAGVPLYVSRSLAMERGESIKPTPPIVQVGTRSWLTDQAIIASCRAEELHHRDPLCLMQLQLQLYIQNEQYEMAQRMRTQMSPLLESMLGFNRGAAGLQQTEYTLLVAMRAAIDDNRLEEAAAMRDRLQAWRAGRQTGSSESELRQLAD